MSKFLYLVVFSTLLASITSKVEATELSFVCPCQAERVSQTAVKITAGVINNGETKSGELRIVLGGSKSLSSAAYSLAVTYPPQTLKPGERYRAGTETTVAFGLPPKLALDSSGRTNLILRLQEKVDDEWATRNTVRIGSPLNFPDPKTGGESAKSKIFLEGKPSLKIEGDQATLLLPRVVNNSLETVAISRIFVGHFVSAEFYGQGYIASLNDESLSITIRAGMSESNIEIKGAYFDPPDTHPFTHFFIESTSGFEIVETIEAREGNVRPTYPFTASSIDFLVDSDDDGVSDFNEDLLNTDPTDTANKPSTVIIDVMALYTPAVDEQYNSEPEAMILHELEWANQALLNSKIDARFRLVKIQAVNY